MPHELVTIGLLQNKSFIRVWDGKYIPVSEEFTAYFEQLRTENRTSSWSSANLARIFDDLS